MDDFSELMDQLEQTLGPDAQRRGLTIANDDDVEIVAVTATLAQGVVHDRGDWNVSLGSGDGFSYSCACPDGRKGTPCAHLWALGLTLEDALADL